MNYYEARAKKVGGKWGYTCMNDGRIFAVGYCVPWEQLVKMQEAASTVGSAITLDETFKDKHHVEGHDTREEACECYRQYLLDQRLSLKSTSSAHYPCEVCEEITPLRASVGHQSWSLCEKHQTRKVVETLMPVVVSSMES